MSELDVQIPTAFDPFAEADAEDSGPGTKEYVHIRIQQRNGRKSLTTVQGLKKEFNYNKILKELKKEFCKGQNTARHSILQTQCHSRYIIHDVVEQNNCLIGSTVFRCKTSLFNIDSQDTIWLEPLEIYE
ncbi:hypothetical protein Drorol1_Dr00015392 [Drosera rotundifolia]